MVKTMGSQKTFDMLKTLGLNSYERKLYVVLLAKGTSSAGTLSELSGVPRSRTYDVLESLADKGFVVIQSNKPLRYVAVRPKEALDRFDEINEPYLIFKNDETDRVNVLVKRDEDHYKLIEP